MSEPYRYNWQADGERTFLKWMVVSLITELNKDGAFEELSEATKSWTQVDLRISINGFDVPVENFVAGIESNMEHFTKVEAKKLLAEGIPEFEKLQDDLRMAEGALRDQLRSRLSAMGIEIEWHEDE